MMRNLISVVAAALAVAVPTAAAPAPERPLKLTPLPQSHVGRVAGTHAFIGLSIDRGVVRAYVCDGTGTRPATIARWLIGRWDGRRSRTLVARGLAVRLGAIGADGRISGTVHALGGVHRFNLRRATAPAGLYDGSDPRRKLRATTVLLGDGSYRGAMIDPRPRKCRPVQVTLADGTVQIVTVCKLG